jgi:hypothetical protein
MRLEGGSITDCTVDNAKAGIIVFNMTGEHLSAGAFYKAPVSIVLTGNSNDTALFNSTKLGGAIVDLTVNSAISVP